jgi:hypothetical protein
MPCGAIETEPEQINRGSSVWLDASSADPGRRDTHSLEALEDSAVLLTVAKLA